MLKQEGRKKNNEKWTTSARETEAQVNTTETMLAGGSCSSLNNGGTGPRNLTALFMRSVHVTSARHLVAKFWNSCSSICMEDAETMH